MLSGEDDEDNASEPDTNSGDSATKDRSDEESRFCCCALSAIEATILKFTITVRKIDLV